MGTRVESTAGGASVAPQMNAVVLDRFGGVDELSPRRIRLPEVGDDDVLIRVEFAGAASWDAVEREGGFDGAFGASAFPYVLGWDAAGTVAAVGRNVNRFNVGDRVYAATIPLPRGGFYAEYAVVEAEFVAHVPDRMPTEQAGAMPWDALAALSGLDLLGLRPEETLMVFGASGGVGHLAVQLARHSGIRVLAVASGDDGVALARRLGADVVVDGRRVDVPAAAFEFAPGGLDGALVTTGGQTAERSLRAIKNSGRIAWPNGLSVPTTSLSARVSHYDGDRSRTGTDRLNAIIEASSFEVHIARTFPMERVKDAHRALNDHYVGKLVLKVG
ncbi:quinone oxidoreductase family protein [Nonomuraea aurantiaca]|uniref:quinone oxidoreductase family protein n=1 Tax=Nonomuraea aurantiaca TaxID=2878562 RepID=UPI001CD976A6|nr:NADP-dependent oxidoreductase [Nonomuraea aurantiaca]MCA2229981.1 NADP-dependent oxidoreductase [Nonomuraea aurantiaca]